jgi:hypothetical protein
MGVKQLPDVAQEIMEDLFCGLEEVHQQCGLFQQHLGNASHNMAQRVTVA